MIIKFQTSVKKNATEVFKKFDLTLFKALKPFGIPLKVIRFDGCLKNHEVHLKMGIQNWTSLITDQQETNEKIFFIDEGVILPFPLKSWKHFHVILKKPIGSVIVDEIHFTTIIPGLEWMLKPFLTWMFNQRAPVYKKFFGEQT